MHVLPAAVDEDSKLGRRYIAAMELAGRYAYAGREWVVERVRRIIGIGLDAYGQKDPLNEYKSEAFALFNLLLDELKERVTAVLGRVELDAELAALPPLPHMIESHPEPAMAYAGAGGNERGYEPAGDTLALSAGAMRSDSVNPADPRTWANSPRNAPCPCGSGKKFKHCHGRMM